MRGFVRQELPEPFKQYLLLGTEGQPTADCDEFEIFFFRSDTKRQADLWKQYRDILMAEWIKDYPGTRPHAWWLFEPPRKPIGTYPGESEASYLKRQGLLSAAEEKRLTAADFEPQSIYEILEEEL